MRSPSRCASTRHPGSMSITSRSSGGGRFWLPGTASSKDRRASRKRSRRTSYRRLDYRHRSRNETDDISPRAERDRSDLPIPFGCAERRDPPPSEPARSLETLPIGSRELRARRRSRKPYPSRRATPRSSRSSTGIEFRAASFSRRRRASMGPCSSSAPSASRLFAVPRAVSKYLDAENGPLAAGAEEVLAPGWAKRTSMLFPPPDATLPTTLGEWRENVRLRVMQCELRRGSGWSSRCAWPRRPGWRRGSPEIRPSGAAALSRPWGSSASSRCSLASTCGSAEPTE